MAGAGRVKVEPSPKRVRLVIAGEVIADTTAALLVWEVPYYPQYYLPLDDVRPDVLVGSAHRDRSPSRGDARFHSLRVGDVERTDAAWEYPDSPIEELRGHLRVEWSAVDHWLEEDEEIHVHPRDPYSRVDILASSRHVEVAVDGVPVADSRRPTLLFETGLPTRYYLPLTDCRLDLLEPSATTSACPYKGTASYWSVRAGDVLHRDLAWTYPSPLLESVKVAGLVCFYNEHVDLSLDGEPQERPRTPFS